jgi:hypothetical protein
MGGAWLAFWWFASCVQYIAVQVVTSNCWPCLWPQAFNTRPRPQYRPYIASPTTVLTQLMVTQAQTLEQSQGTADVVSVNLH